jgi:hypothetical protein
VTDTDEVVRIGRERLGVEDIDAIPLSGGDSWLVVWPLTDVELDGPTLLRRSDITSMRPTPQTRFLTEHLTLVGERVELAPWILQDDPRDVMQTCTELDDMLVAVYVEQEDPDVAFVGRVTGVTGEDILLHEMSSAAEWVESSSRWAWEAITRVDLAHRYEHALLRVATRREVGRDTLGPWPPSSMVRGHQGS